MTFRQLCKGIRIATYIAIIIDAVIKIVKTARGDDEKKPDGKQRALFEADSPKKASINGLSGVSAWTPVAEMEIREILAGRPGVGKSMPEGTVIPSIEGAVSRALEEMRSLHA